MAQHDSACCTCMPCFEQARPLCPYDVVVSAGSCHSGCPPLRQPVTSPGRLAGHIQSTQLLTGLSDCKSFDRQSSSSRKQHFLIP